MTTHPGSSDRGGPLPTTRVRSYAARRGRLSPLTLQRLERFAPSLVVVDDPDAADGPEEGGEPPLPVEVLDTATAFGRRAPLVLEVGCGHGAAAIAYARAHPEHDVLASDVHTPGIARMLAAADRAGVRNLRVAWGDAVPLLADRLQPGTLAAVHLFFPDPWPKNKHAKRRFIGADTLSLLDSRLAPGGWVLVATDQAAYAEHVRSQVRADGRFVVLAAERPPWRPVDGFERMALEAGRAVVELRLERATRIELA